MASAEPEVSLLSYESRKEGGFHSGYPSFGGSDDGTRRKLTEWKEMKQQTVCQACVKRLPKGKETVTEGDGRKEKNMRWNNNPRLCAGDEAHKKAGLHGLRNENGGAVQPVPVQ